MKNLVTLLIAILLVVPAGAQTIVYKTLGTWNSDGVPNYLEPIGDVIPQSLLNRINATLPESVRLPSSHPEFLNDTIQTNLYILQESDVWVTFVSEGAGYKNALGFYTYNVNTPPQTVNDIMNTMTLIFPNSSAKNSGGGLVAGNKVKIGRFQPGTVIGWFVVADGFRSPNVTQGNWINYSNRNLNWAPTPDLRQHNVLLNDLNSGRIVLAFEDISRYRGGDQDFNDVVFYATANPPSGVSYTNIPLISNPTGATVANLKLTKTVDKANPSDNEIVNFTITATNLGTDGATNVVLKDVLPKGIKYQGHSVSTGAYDTATGLWRIASLAINATATLTLQGKVSIKSISQAAFDLGPAKDFNIFTLGDLTQPSADSEGKVAVGKNAYFASYSLGDLLPASGGTADVLIVGNNLMFISGNVTGGNVVYGGTSNLPISQVSIIDGTVRKDSVINFLAAGAYLNSLSASLSAYHTTGTITYNSSGIQLYGYNPFLNVFNISGKTLSNCTNFTINAPNGAVVLVNVDSSDVKWSGDVIVNGTAHSNVLYNFHDALNLKISFIDVRGSILAPKAHLDFPSGVINGQVIVREMYGSGQFNSAANQTNYFNGTLPVTRDILNSAEVVSMDQTDLDTTNNYASAMITLAGYGDPGQTGSVNWQPAQPSGLTDMVWVSTWDNSGNILAGTWGGKILKSTDNGVTWERINPTMNVGYLWDIDVVGSTIYASTELGVFKSTDNGATWNITGMVNKDVRSLTIKNSVLYAGTWGEGVFKSTNGGTTWSQTNAGLQSTAVTAMLTASNGTIYAGTFNGGLYKSDDNGASWSKTTLNYQFIWSLGQSANGRIYAGTYGGGVYRSIDNGTTWYAINNNLTATHIYSIVTDPQNHVFVSGWGAGVFTLNTGSMDAMTDDWNYMGMGGLEVSSIIINPTSGSLLAFTSAGGLYINNSPTTSIGTEKEILNPEVFSLSQNYPNPFNPSTTIGFNLPEASEVTLKVYDVTGREVALIAEGSFAKGSHKVSFDARSLTSGIYFYRIQAGSFVETKRAVLLK
ncbi:MAG: choice-of-anchor A family protein [Ignavibacteria bacterium]|nr:choice-of-anchor A family protein [Ignavibacteria bacterium]